MHPAEKKKPGPAKGSAGHPNGGPKKRPQTLETAAFITRACVFDKRYRPTDVALAAALGISRPTWLRRVAGQGNLTAEQLVAGNALLDQAAPWLTRLLLPAEFDEESAAR